MTTSMWSPAVPNNIAGDITCSRRTEDQMRSSRRNLVSHGPWNLLTLGIYFFLLCPFMKFGSSLKKWTDVRMPPKKLSRLMNSSGA